MIQEISLQAIQGVRIGNAENTRGGTGCTVLLFPHGAVCSIDIRGGAPASRETALLDPVATAEAVHAVLLSGGSAFGLAAADGVMRYLQEQGVGFATRCGPVPLVVGSCIFDLPCGDIVYPDAAMGYAACRHSEENAPQEGNYGAGTGASVGKIAGASRMMKAGLGMFAVQSGALQVGAVMVVNALGDVLSEKNTVLAGLRTPDGGALASTQQYVWEHMEAVSTIFTGTVENTTIGAVITNGGGTKTQMKKVAAMASNGLVRAVSPVNTTADGDSIYAASVGKVPASVDEMGILASYAVTCAVRRAVRCATGAYGIPARRDLIKNK